MRILQTPDPLKQMVVYFSQEASTETLGPLTDLRNFEYVSHRPFKMKLECNVN